MSPSSVLDPERFDPSGELLAALLERIETAARTCNNTDNQKD